MYRMTEAVLRLFFDISVRVQRTGYEKKEGNGRDGGGGAEGESVGR